MIFGMNIAKISNVIAHPEFIVKGNVSAFNNDKISISWR